MGFHKATFVKTSQRDIPFPKTVGFVQSRYRLGHRWVSEMMLNVQSGPQLVSSFHLRNFRFDLEAGMFYLGDKCLFEVLLLSLT